MDAKSLRAKADQLLRKHGGKIDKGLNSAERFAKKRSRGNPARARQVEQVAGKAREALTKQRLRSR